MSKQQNQIAKTFKAPTLTELSTAYDEGLITQGAAKDGLLQILNTPPPEAWLKNHPFINIKKEVEGRMTSVPYKYLAIDRVEFLLNNLFKEWRIEVKSYSMMANSACVEVRVHYQNPITKEWSFEDGLGAAPVQTDKNEGACDWMKVKTDGVQKALPAAKSYAIKDACECIGQIFGTNIARDNQFNYDFTKDHKESFEEMQDSKEKARAIAAIESAQDTRELDNLLQVVSRYELGEQYREKRESLKY